MRNLVKRGQGYYARLIIPQDRWQDAGKVMGCRSGIRREVVRTLGTRDHREAIRRREKMLETMRAELDAKLMQAGLLPLHGEWCPTVTQSVLEAWSPSSPRGKASPDEQAVVDGLAYRQDLQAASGEYIVRDNPYQSHDGLPDTERERLTDVVREKVQDKAEAMPPAAGGRYYRAAMGIIEGTLTPLGGLLDRWDKDRERMISKASRAMDQAAFNHFAEYVIEAKRQGLTKTPRDSCGASELCASNTNASPMDALRLIGIQQIEPRVIGGFVEWLLDTKGLAVKTAQSRVSPLKVFWQWCIRKHMIPGPNPWTGATEGMKKQAQRGDRGHWGGRGQETGRHHNQRRERREFSEGELTKLLNTDPDEGRRWAWGPAIRDLMRLAVLTGARENELCSLTVRHILNREPGSGGGTHLWGMAVMDEEAKTASSVRRIPLHPLARTIIERRLSQTDGSPDAPLFPECKPGGPDGKRGYYFAKRFTTFRRAVLGAEESDGWVTFHSFRKNFATYMQRASVAGVSDCQLSVIQKLMGHKPQTITESVYMEKELQWSVYERAIIGMVGKGMPEGVRRLLVDQSTLAV